MSKPILAKFATSLATLGLAAACASTAATSVAGVDADLPQKPSQDEIEIAERADPLTRANFWNTQYNLFPTDADITVSFSKALREIGSHERAAEVANIAAVSHPENHAVILEVARAEQAQGNLLQAVRAYAAAAELKPFDATPYAAVGTIYDSRGEHEAAQVAYREALEIDPNRPATLSNYGLSLALQGNLDKAEEKLREAVSLADATAQVRQNFALILSLQGKFDEARDIARQDASEHIAEKNLEFIAQMIGKDVRLERISEAAGADTQIAETVHVEVPKAAPTETVKSETIEEPTELASQEPPRPRLRGTLAGRD
ncbi:MAG: tetratricopeptide repeat protein [Pseudomonadota bacterium]